jgi:CBS-domain-containing membrane protein
LPSTAQLTGWRDRRPSGLGRGAYSGALCLGVLAVAGWIGVLTKQPWLFPSLGPTVMLFFESPEQPTARPQNALIGHVVGIAVGYACLRGFGLLHTPPAPVGGLTGRYVAAAALSVAITSLVLVLIHLPHPPAGASTLIVSLGVLTSRTELFTMVLAVGLVTAMGFAITLLLGDRQRPRSHTH